METADVTSPPRVEPDLDFIKAVREQAGGDFKKCFQCGTCSATCALSPETDPFPRKEMAWAAWGLRDRLLADQDVWLCHQCNDCSIRCPRGGRPGDVLAAVRREAIQRYSFPGFLARWVAQPKYLPLLLAVPVALLALALRMKVPLGKALGFAPPMGDRITFAYSNMLPHWLINTFFGLFTALALIAISVGVVRFWRAMKAATPPERIRPPAKGIVRSIGAAVRRAFTHQDFDDCTAAHSRFPSHLLVFFGFTALTLVTLWVITSRVNPLISSDFVYPMNFMNPVKVLANLGGLALMAGCVLMLKDRLMPDGEAGSSTYFDWVLLAALLLVALSGFVTEILHYQRLEPHRHVAYFAHLVFVLALLMYLPYSKLAHVIYRTTALVFAEYSGRREEVTAPAMTAEMPLAKKEAEPVNAPESGRALLPVVLVLILLFPLGYHLVDGVLAKGAEPGEVFLEKPEGECVKPTDYMRFHHWELLREVREEVVRHGKRNKPGLNRCKECHTSRVNFCDRCHEATSLRPDCWNCHDYP